MLTRRKTKRIADLTLRYLVALLLILFAVLPVLWGHFCFAEPGQISGERHLVAKKPGIYKLY